MINRDEVAELLSLQSSAYELLMWLADEGSRIPELLSPEDVARLREPETAAAWLLSHREKIPTALMPAQPVGAFTNLFCSFFSTSFSVRHLEFNDHLVESRVTLGLTVKSVNQIGLNQSQALALKHLAASEKMPITQKEAHRLVDRKPLREASLLWTYVWELDRRLKNKGKGPVAHHIWRSIPWETKRSLDVDQVWQAREQLLSAVREYCATLGVTAPTRA